MSVEIEEYYPRLLEFYYLSSLAYEQFRPLSLRWDNEADRKALFKRIHKTCEEIIIAKGNITRIYKYKTRIKWKII